MQSEAELIALRNSIRSGRPFGAPEWTEQMAERLNIELNPCPQGRPPGKNELTLGFPADTGFLCAGENELTPGFSLPGPAPGKNELTPVFSGFL